MSKEIYSFGVDSPMKFHISDRLARNYNSAVGKWIKAHRRFAQRFGREWNPGKDPIGIRWSNSEKNAWNTFARVFAAVNEKEGPFRAEELYNDFLVKNVAVVASLFFVTKVIPNAALAGAIYETFMPEIYALLRSRSRGR